MQLRFVYKKLLRFPQSVSYTHLDVYKRQLQMKEKYYYTRKTHSILGTIYFQEPRQQVKHHPTRTTNERKI